MGILLLFYLAIWTLLYLTLIGVTSFCVKSHKTTLIIVIILIIYPFRTFLFHKSLSLYYQHTPLQQIYKTVKSPGSVYWEDNVWPGFDEYGRYWMIDNYLDGKNLKVLSMNGDDGKIYLYRATVNDFRESERLRPALDEKLKIQDDLLAKAKKIYKEGGDNKWLGPLMEKNDKELIPIRKRFNQQREKDIKAIMKKGQIFTTESDLPSMNYKVVFNLLPKSLFVNNDFKIFHADRISISDMKTNKEIAFSRRYMAYAGFISSFGGSQPKFDYIIGDERAYEFDDKVLFGYAKAKGTIESLRSRLERDDYIHRFSSGWKRRNKSGGMRDAR